MRGSPLTLGYLLSENPKNHLEFVCQACPHWTRKPMAEMVLAYGEQKLLKDVKPRCTKCGARGDKVEMRVWKDTWSGPR